MTGDEFARFDAIALADQIRRKTVSASEVLEASIVSIDKLTDAEVELRNDKDRALNKTIADAFGDFKFDHIEPGSGAYVIAIKHSRYGSASVNVNVSAESVFAGDILLH